MVLESTPDDTEKAIREGFQNLKELKINVESVHGSERLKVTRGS